PRPLLARPLRHETVGRWRRGSARPLVRHPDPRPGGPRPGPAGHRRPVRLPAAPRLRADAVPRRPAADLADPPELVAYRKDVVCQVISAPWKQALAARWVASRARARGRRPPSPVVPTA